VREAALDALRPRARSGRGRALTILERSEKTYADFWVRYTPVCLELLRAPSDVAISISRDFLCSPGPVEPQVMLCREQCVAMFGRQTAFLVHCLLVTWQGLASRYGLSSTRSLIEPTGIMRISLLRLLLYAVSLCNKFVCMLMS